MVSFLATKIVYWLLVASAFIIKKPIIFTCFKLFIIPFGPEWVYTFVAAFIYDPHFLSTFICSSFLDTWIWLWNAHYSELVKNLDCSIIDYKVQAEIARDSGIVSLEHAYWVWNPVFAYIGIVIILIFIPRL
jgi:hypothetical protein